MAAGRLVELAVDAAGIAGGRTYTYHVPEHLGDLAPGEAVIVEFGRRQVLAIVIEETGEPLASVVTKPVLERVRGDGPLLPPLQLGLARHIAGHYLAPAALVVRAMLPPGTLERVELVAAWVGPDAPPASDTALVRVAASGPEGIAVSRLAGEGDRPSLSRRLQAEVAAGRLTLDRRLRPPDVRRRYERRARLTPDGRDLASRLAAGNGPTGRPVGHRQAALVAELARLSDDAWLPTAGLVERHGSGGLAGLVRRGALELETVAVERRPLAGRDREARALPEAADLAPDQAAAVDAIVAAVRARRPEAFLLDGVTASGKTAVYVAAIAEALRMGRGALVLVPEIALAAPLLDRLRTELGTDVAILHSGLGDGERSDEWLRIRGGGVSVVVGTRLAVLAPLADPGLVVVDEEHDAGYKSDRTPRYQARDLALVLGRLNAAPVVLASATPDVASVGHAQAGAYRHLRLSERVVGRPAVVEVVDLRAELAAGNRSLLSAPLAAALASLDTSAGERAILVLNRRGSASVVLCRDCGYVQVCPECHRPLVFHAVGMALRCHHCGATAPTASRCPACTSPRIRYLGGGTERLEREVGERYPTLRVGRLDRDVVERKGAAEQVVDAFTDGALDVLVGTSLVTKGLDVPGVTLVGVVSADIALSLPDERAAERTYQFLRQAIGRAGRGERPGRAIVQTYLPEHPVIRAVADGDAAIFYREELASRRAFGSPPFGSLIKLTVALEDRVAAEAEGRRLAGILRERALAAGAGTTVLGPAPAYVARRAGRWRFHLVLRGRDPLATLGGDPGPPWTVDVDPESLL